MRIGIRLVKVVLLAKELFGCDKKVQQWFMTRTEVFCNMSPFEVIMEGRGIIIMDWLEERLGRKSGTAF